IVAIHLWIVPDMTRSRRLQRHEICAKRAFVSRAIFPELAPGLPVRTQAFVVRDRILNNESFNAVRVRKCHAKTDRTSVILHVKRIERKSERFGEMIYDLGEVIERIREFFRVRPVAVPKARVIRRDKVIAIRKLGEERLEHSRRRWKSVQQENRRRIFWAGLPIKDCESIHLYRAIKSRVFLSLVLRR